MVLYYIGMAPLANVSRKNLAKAIMNRSNVTPAERKRAFEVGKKYGFKGSKSSSGKMSFTAAKHFVRELQQEGILKSRVGLGEKKVTTIGATAGHLVEAMAVKPEVAPAGPTPEERVKQVADSRVVNGKAAMGRRLSDENRREGDSTKRIRQTEQKLDAKSETKPTAAKPESNRPVMERVRSIPKVPASERQTINVVPAEAGTQKVPVLDPRVRGNDITSEKPATETPAPVPETRAPSASEQTEDITSTSTSSEPPAPDIG
jgi:hypothetical protein